MTDKASYPEEAVRHLIRHIGDDETRGGLLETPARVASAWKEWTLGYHLDPAPLLKTFEDGSEKYDEMILLGPIPMYSHCEHHMAPFFGQAFVGYIPNGCIVGLSKISRLVDVYARRLQVQERLTTQIVDTIAEHLQPLGVGVVLRCRHLCMESRGISKPGIITTTSAMYGALRAKPEARAEFLDFVRVSASDGV